MLILDNKYIFEGEYKQRLVISKYTDIFKNEKIRFRILNTDNFKADEIIDLDYNQVLEIIDVLQNQIKKII